MKFVTKLLVSTAAALFMASCATPTYKDASGNPIQENQVVGAKGEAYVSDGKGVVEVDPVDEIVAPAPFVNKSKQGCTKCLSHFCPEPDCCGTVSKAVLSRATAQGGTGEPHIGLIPTMKSLAPN